MKASLNWLRQYVDIKSTPSDLSKKLTLAGLAVDSMEEIDPWPGIVIGRVLEVTKHPNADKLSLTTVDIGKEKLRIVCGASNVKAAQTVAVATVGAILPGNFEIKKAKIRGEESAGMICSKSELGLEKEKSPGIWELENTQRAVLGQTLAAYLGLADVLYDIDVTTSRPDCLNMTGIAREIAIFEDLPLKLPEPKIDEAGESIDKYITISIEDSEGCPRYSARLIRGVTVGPSPGWLVQRLESVGLRSINNIVDITNFVMLETGQPLHAFDYDQIGDQKIIVRRSKSGDRFQTLDDKVHTLNDDVVMICDGHRPVALGGIMGGKNSEVSEGTKNILLEAAFFDLKRTRRSAKQLGIQTDASTRFGKGVDPEGTVQALNRAVALMKELAGGEIVRGVAEKRTAPPEVIEVRYRPADAIKLTGVDIPEDEMERIFQKLECTVQRSAAEWVVKPPSFRTDLRQSADLIEEVIRVYGYDKVPYSFSAVVTYAQDANKSEKFATAIRNHMKPLGFFEVVTNPMVKSTTQSAVAPEAKQVRIVNPINEDMAVMRASLLPSLLEVVRGNLSRKNDDIRIYEIGRCFSAQAENELPSEQAVLAGCMAGNRQPAHWSYQSEPVDFFDLKNVISSVCGQFLLDTVTFTDYHHDIFSQGALEVVGSSGSRFGRFGKLSKSLLRSYDIDKEVWYFELPYLDLEHKADFKKTHRAISRFPSIERDLAFVVDSSLAAGDLMKSIRKAGGPLLGQLDVFDLYIGDQVDTGKKSIAFSLQYRSNEKTLTDNEVEDSIRSIVKAVEKTFGARLR